ncbi:UEV domain-containing protein [Mycena metata]|uniref:UEV domain-containing protein n=1 Tax=Mycena metata TaxID=1033252 RepID=A0AAD7K177_9AGAR|nr:UEV domain-containing protein [Mycena metata]
MDQLSLTQKWLREQVASYSAGERVFADVDSALARFPSLRPKSDVYTYDDGRTQLLLCIHGLLPITFRGASYNIPVAVWLTREYPREPPLPYVVPTADMLVKPGPHLDVSGRSSVDYVQQWARKSEGCSLSSLIDAMQAEFSRVPPVYAKPKDTTQVAQASRPSPVQQSGQSSTQSPARPQPPVLPPKPQTPLSPQNTSQGGSQAPQYHPQSQPPPNASHAPQYNISPPQYQPQRSQSPQYTLQQPPPQSSGYSGGTPQASPAPQYAGTFAARPPPPLPPHPRPDLGPPQYRPAPAPAPPPPHYQAPPVPWSPPADQQPQWVASPNFAAPAPGPPPPPALAPNFLDEEAPGTVLHDLQAVSGAPAPPRPPNPELLRLHAAVHVKLSSELSSLGHALALDAERLRAHQADLLAGEPAIRDEMGRLEAVRDVCRTAAGRMRGAVEAAERNVADLKGKSNPEVDELVCSTTIVHNQLINLVAEDNAIEDTTFHLSKALNSGRIDLERFLRSCRLLAEEQFMKRALIEKIQANILPMGQSGY